MLPGDELVVPPPISSGGSIEARSTTSSRSRLSAATRWGSLSRASNGVLRRGRAILTRCRPDIGEVASRERPSKCTLDLPAVVAVVRALLSDGARPRSSRSPARSRSAPAARAGAARRSSSPSTLRSTPASSRRRLPPTPRRRSRGSTRSRRIAGGTTATRTRAGRTTASPAFIGRRSWGAGRSPAERPGG